MSGRCQPSIMTEEDSHLISHLADLAASVSGCAVGSAFLTIRERKLAAWELGKRGLAASLFFYGGCLDSFRKMAVFLPDWMDFSDLPSDPLDPLREQYLLELVASGMEGGYVEELLTPVKLIGSGYHTLGHRDWLGGLMALGIKRESLGDLVLINDKEALLFAQKKIVPFLSEEFTRAGNDVVRVEKTAVDFFAPLPRKYLDKTITAASPRLDGVIHSLVNQARSDVQFLIQRGEVQLNETVTQKPDIELEKGDVVSVRGFGKFLVDSDAETTQKGRVRFHIRIFQ